MVSTSPELSHGHHEPNLSLMETAVKYSVSLQQGWTQLVIQEPSRGLGNTDILNQDDKAKTSSARWRQQSSEDRYSGSTFTRKLGQLLSAGLVNMSRESGEGEGVKLTFSFSPHLKWAWRPVQGRVCEGKGSEVTWEAVQVRGKGS